jgi:FixJ family two-component response regulator
MVSAYGDMDNIRTAMNRGAFDFVCKPVNFQDLELTIEKTLHHVITKENAAMQHDCVKKVIVEKLGIVR